MSVIKKFKDNPEIHKILADAWLNIKVSDKEMNNPLHWPKEFADKPEIYLTWVLSQPEYFGFLSEQIFNITLTPMQMCILKVLWQYKFPMLIMSRGGSKCIKGSHIITSDGIRLIDDMFDQNCPTMTQLPINTSLLGENGFNKPQYKWKNDYSKTIKVKTNNGYSLEGTLNHPIRVVADGNIIWKDLDDIQLGDYCIIDRTTEWFKNTNSLTVDHGYLFGCLVGDGGYTVRGRIGFTSQDVEIVDSLNIITENLFGRRFKKVKSKYQYYIWSTELWDKLFTEYGFNSSACGEKDFPSSILSSKKDVVASFIRGLMDTDGMCQKNRKRIIYCSKSIKLVKTLQFVLTKFGIISRLKSRLNKKYNRHYHYLYISGDNVDIFNKDIGFGLQRKRNILQSVLNKKSNTNIDIIPKDLVINQILSLKNIFKSCSSDYSRYRKLFSNYYLDSYEISYQHIEKILECVSSYEECINSDVYKYILSLYSKRYYFDKVESLSYGFAETYDMYIPDDHSFLSGGFISHNSFLLALYNLIRLLLLPRRKIVIAGAAFRQSKVIFQYMEDIWNNAPLYRDIVKSNGYAEFKHETDLYAFYINGGSAKAIPIGNGEKIRGLRANDLITDEFNCLDGNTLCQTNRGLISIKDIVELDQDIRIKDQNGNFVYPKRYIRTPTDVDCYTITTTSGYSFTCSEKHQVMTSEGFKFGKELTNEDWLPLSFDNYFPKEYISSDYVLDENMGWFIGILLSEGSVTSDNTISITNTDFNLIDQISNYLNTINIKHSIDFRDSYIDNRGWRCKESKVIRIHNTNFRNWLLSIGLDKVTAHNKIIPWAILQSPKIVVASFLNGLFEGDGSVFNFKDSYGIRCGISYYSVNEKLIDQLQVLLLKFNILSNKQKRRSKISHNTQWMLRLNGKYVRKFISEIKSDWNIYLQEVIQDKYKLARCYHNPLNNKWRAKVQFCGQHKHIGYYISKEEALEAAQNFIDTHNQEYVKVKSVKKLSSKNILYDLEIDTTNSFIGNGFIQHNSVPRDIFETVMAGFTAVSADPIGNVIEAAAKKKAKEMGLDLGEEKFDPLKVDNQLVLSGTAGYKFQHFYDYWQDWHDIVCSRGDKTRLERYIRKRAEKFGDGYEDIIDQLNWKDYAIIRIPFELIPDGFMDTKQIIRAKATMHSGTYMNEYGASFSDDSNGFFKRSLIESCTATPANGINKDGGKIVFEAKLVGEKGKEYVFGIDPASEVDNFAIVILELNPDHNRVVYCWTTNSAQHKEEIREGIVDELDFYSYCAKKIRNLMRRFPCKRLMLDSQGGGKSVYERLHDLDKLQFGEPPIWEVIDKDKPKDTDSRAGIHILELCNFADATWTSEANHGLRQDMEMKFLLFPFFDAVSIVKAEGSAMNLSYDTLDFCMTEVEELKNELSTIVITQTNSGRDKWDTPETKLPGGRKGRMRKDRYSALIMANMAARKFLLDQTPTIVMPYGGFASKTAKIEGPMYTGNQLWANALNKIHSAL